jgi:hypothetical protein
MEEKLSLLFPSIDQDVLTDVVEHARDYVRDYCNISEIPETLESVVWLMCREDLSRVDAEGLSSESAGDSSITYAEDYSPRVYKRLKKHKRMRVI